MYIPIFLCPLSQQSQNPYVQTESHHHLVHKPAHPSTLYFLEWIPPCTWLSKQKILGIILGQHLSLGWLLCFPTGISNSSCVTFKYTQIPHQTLCSWSISDYVTSLSSEARDYYQDKLLSPEAFADPFTCLKEMAFPFPQGPASTFLIWYHAPLRAVHFPSWSAFLTCR